MSNKTQTLPTFAADFSAMAFPKDYVGGTRIRHPRTAESQAVTTRISVVR